MKSLIIFVALIVSMFFIASSVFTAEQQAIESTDQNEYKVPEDKKREWKSIRNHILDEYNVCTEHCGKEQICLERCEKVYRHRLEMEYRNIMSR